MSRRKDLSPEATHFASIATRRSKDKRILRDAVRAARKDTSEPKGAPKEGKRPLQLTPIGTARFAYLSQPDDYMGRKRYRTQLLLSKAEAVPLQEAIRKLVDEAFDANVENAKDAKAKKAAAGYRKKYPFEDDVDAEGNETGLVVFKFAQNAVITLKDGTEKEVRPLLVDAQRRPVDPDSVRVYGGSRIRVAFSARAYANASAEAVGVTLDLAKVQIIELSKRDGNYQDSTFDDVEGGWSQSSIDDDDADGSHGSGLDSDLPF